MSKDQKLAAGILSGLALLGLVAFVLFWAWLQKDLAATDYQDSSALAYDACSEFVEKNLKVPGSAVWPDDVERDSEPLGEGRFRVRSHMVAKNALGVPIRFSFDCTVEQKGESGWRLISLEKE